MNARTTATVALCLCVPLLAHCRTAHADGLDGLDEKIATIGVLTGIGATAGLVTLGVNVHHLAVGEPAGGWGTAGYVFGTLFSVGGGLLILGGLTEKTDGWMFWAPGAGMLGTGIAMILVPAIDRGPDVGEFDWNIVPTVMPTGSGNSVSGLALTGTW